MKGSSSIITCYMVCIYVLLLQSCKLNRMQGNINEVHMYVCQICT